jgi:hypothetical protein
VLIAVLGVKFAPTGHFSFSYQSFAFCTDHCRFFGFSGEVHEETTIAIKTKMRRFSSYQEFN